ncbi:MAG: hypothetical protein PVI86_02910 [Phycisphaerae bacterium]
MTDRRQLEQLIRSRHPCIFVVTNNEDCALDVIREAAFQLNRNMRV